jgi:hypothetical protein
MEYGAEIWGHRKYAAMESVHNRACRFMLNAPNKAPNAAVHGDSGWITPLVKQHIAMARMWHRLSQMPASRLARRVLDVQFTFPRRNNWAQRVKQLFLQYGLTELSDLNICENFSKKTLITKLKEKSLAKAKTTWQAELDREKAKCGNGGNKLRLYRDLKPDFNGATYVKQYMSRRERRVLFQFRAGCAPIQMEIARYNKNGYVPPAQRICPVCNLEPEDETHFLVRCPIYKDTRSELFKSAVDFNVGFINFSDREKAIFVLSEPDIAKETARACNKMLCLRTDVLMD